MDLHTACRAVVHRGSTKLGQYRGVQMSKFTKKIKLFVSTPKKTERGFGTPPNLPEVIVYDFRDIIQIVKKNWMKKNNLSRRKTFSKKSCFEKKIKLFKKWKKSKFWKSKFWKSKILKNQHFRKIEIFENRNFKKIKIFEKSKFSKIEIFGILKFYKILKFSSILFVGKDYISKVSRTLLRALDSGGTSNVRRLWHCHDRVRIAIDPFGNPREGIRGFELTGPLPRIGPGHNSTPIEHHNYECSRQNAPGPRCGKLPVGAWDVGAWWWHHAPTIGAYDT